MVNITSTNILDIVALALIALHFGVPLIYYIYLKRKWLNRPWNIGVDLNHTPRMTIIIPTYNEADFIEKKMDNIYKQDYPRDKLEIVVVDSASTDGTPEKVEEWHRKNPDIRLKLIREPVRRGKLYAVLNAINKVVNDTDIIVLTDADAFFQPDSLKHLAKYFKDESVGAVTASIKYMKDRNMIEDIYREFYNQVRIAESKKHSTPVHNGPLQAFKADIIRRVGLPDFPGADDSAFASYIAFAGYRAIQVDDVWVYEPYRGSTLRRKIRRAQHLTLSFLYTKKHAKKKGVYRRTIFEHIWYIEYYLHIVNPWLLLTATLLLVTSLIQGSLLAMIPLLLGATVLVTLRPAKTWILQQIYLIIAMIKNIWTRSETWSH